MKTEQEKQKTKCPFFKMILMCFPMLKKKPSAEQQEIIEAVQDAVDEIQEQIEDLVDKQEPEAEE